MSDLEFVNSVPAVLGNADAKFGVPKFTLPHGASSVTYKTQASTGVTIGSGSNYSINVSENQMVSNMLLEQVRIQYQVNVVNNSGAAYTPTLESLTAPNFMPLAMNSNSLQVTLNGNAFTLNCQDIVDKLLTFNKLPDMSEYDLSMSPNALDIFSTYPSSALTGNPVYGAASGSIKNPFADFSQATYGNSGRWTQVQDVSIAPAFAPIANAGNQTYTIQFTVTEAILNQTTAMTVESARAWSGLTNLQVTRNYLTSGDVGTRLIKVVAIPGVGVAATVVANSVQIIPLSAGNAGPNLLYTVYTLDDSFSPPAKTKYPLTAYQPLYRSNQTGAIAAAAQITLVSPSIPLQYVPSAIYLFIARTTGLTTAYLSEAPGCRITNISMDYVTSGNFASASEQVLYQEFAANQGCMKSLAEFSTCNIAGVAVGMYGSLYRIDGANLPIDWQKYSVGSPYRQDLQFTVTGTSLRADNFQLYTFVVDSGYYELSQNECIQRIGIATSDVVAKCRADARNFEAHQPKFGGILSNAARQIVKGFGSAIHRMKHIAVTPKKSGGKRHKVKHVARRGRGEADKECGCGYDEHCQDCFDECDECNPQSEYEEDIRTGGRVITKSAIAKRLNY